MSISDVTLDMSTEIAAHHDAFIVQLTGRQLLPASRVAWLIEKGYITAEQIGPLKLPGMPEGMDPFMAAEMIGVRMGGATQDEIVAMRRWTLKEWSGEIESMVDERTTGPPQDPPMPPTASHGGKPATPPGQPGLPIPQPPTWMSMSEREAWVQAYTRGSEYVRGLGNTVDDQARTMAVESWDEAVPTEVPKPGLRAEVAATIRELTADALARGKTARDLASDLGNATGDWARDWLRIARTELQGAYNDGVMIRAIRIHGDNAMVARIPHDDACVHCQRLFLGDGGIPKVFNADELLQNGTNVGRKAADWEPTVWPVHPHCRCDTQVVPPGFVFDEDWMLVPEGM